MRPDRIIVGEVRAGEALDMLQAMNTGHEGSLATVHANTSSDALARLETLASMSDVEVPFRALHEQVNEAVDIVVQLQRGSDGTRRITEVACLESRRDAPFEVRPVMTWEPEHVGLDGKRGAFVSHPVPRSLVRKLRRAGEELPGAVHALDPLTGTAMEWAE
jgi:pilus assembly protein CpaF